MGYFMLDKVEVLKDNGERLMYDEISMFEVAINGTTKKYAVLTNNELDPNGLTKLSVAEITGDRLAKITDDTEWSIIKNVLRSIISNSSYDFNYINIDGKFTMAGDVFRIIAVQEAAKTQLISDFAAKKPSQVTTLEKNNTPTSNQTPTQEPAIDPSIYPTSTPNNNLGSEIIPGIMEANNDLVNVTPPDVGPLEEINVSDNGANNIVNDIPNGDAPAIDIPGFSSPAPNPVVDNPAVAPVVPTPVEPTPVGTESNPPISGPIPEVKPIADQPVATNVTANNDNARTILTDKILAAVDEYVKSTSNSTSGNNEEVEDLKKQLKEMEDKLKNIMSLIGS